MFVTHVGRVMGNPLPQLDGKQHRSDRTALWVLVNMPCVRRGEFGFPPQGSCRLYGTVKCWEQTLYACGDRSSIRRVAYSCEIYTRFVYGECRFDKRRDRVNTVISYDDCNQQNCRLYQYVNLD
ncbi:hypothetical protein V8F33_009193 [Rhypophila sp. PSN 637]